MAEESTTRPALTRSAATVLDRAALLVRDEEPGLGRAFDRLRSLVGPVPPAEDPAPDRVAIDDVVEVLTALVEAGLQEEPRASRPNPASVRRRRRDALAEASTREIVRHLGARVARRIGRR